METRRMELVLLDPDNISRDLDSAQVRALTDAGYTPGPAFLYQQAKDAPHRLACIMVPPRPPDPALAAVARSLRAAVAVAALVSALAATGALASLLAFLWSLL